MKEIVYFIAYDDPEYRTLLPFVKIGKAKNLSYRLMELQIASPIKLGVVGFIRVKDACTLEKTLHLRYVNDNVSGEWFRRSVGMVKSLRANYIVEADRFDDFVDMEAKCAENVIREHYEPKFRDFEKLSTPIEINNKKLDNRQNNWDYNSLKPIKLRR